MWIGAGPRPGAGAADHVLWSDPDAQAARAPYDGSLSLRYHMLWELTHVCFDHPGLLTPPEDDARVGPVGSTLSGEGRLAEVVSVPEVPEAHAVVRTSVGVEVVETAQVGPLVVGALIVVCDGSAVAVLEEAG